MSGLTHGRRPASTAAAVHAPRTLTAIRAIPNPIAQPVSRPFVAWRSTRPDVSVTRTRKARRTGGSDSAEPRYHVAITIDAMPFAPASRSATRGSSPDDAIAATSARYAGLV